MKKALSLFYFFTLLQGIVYSQSTLTYDNTSPQVGESFVLHTFDVLGINAGNSGLNIFWDFSGIASGSSETVNMVNPSATPQGSNFPNSVVAYKLNNTWEYLKSDINEFSRNGFVTPNGIVIKYSKPQQLFSFPFTYNSVVNDSFSGQYTSNGNNVFRHGVSTTTADGYGTLLLPFGTYYNVLRLQYEEEYQDDVNGVPQMTYLNIIYEWYQIGTHFPLLTLTFTTINGATNKYGYFIDQNSIGINNQNARIHEIKTYPNPASKLLNIEFSELYSEEIYLEVINSNGQPVLNESIKNKHHHQINTSVLTAGLYLVRIKHKNFVEVIKIVIHH